MAYKCIKSEVNSVTKEEVQEFLLDAESDLATLPECGSGSIAMVVGSGLPIWMKNASGEWVTV